MVKISNFFFNLIIILLKLLTILIEIILKFNKSSAFTTKLTFRNPELFEF